MIKKLILAVLALSAVSFAQNTGTFSGGTVIVASNSAAAISGTFSCATPITTGNTSLCSWNISGAASTAGSVAVNNGLYSCSSPCPGSSSATTAALSVTTTYILTASNAAASITVPFTVVVSPLPTASITPGTTTINLNTCGGSCTTAVPWTATSQNTIDIVRNSDGVSKLHCLSSCAGSGSFTDSPTATTTYTITVNAIAGGQAIVNSVPVVVTPLTGGGSVTDTNRYDNPDNTCNGLATDGGAAPLGNCFYTALAGTPSPGKTVAIASGCSVFPCANDLGTIYNGAGVSCGDTITLAAGATWAYGANHVLTLNSKGCDNAHWITIRTSTLDANLPDQQTEITPCWANIASLTGRPSFSCPSGGAAALMPILSIDGSNSMNIQCDHCRFIGIKFTTNAPVPGGTTQIADLTGANHVIFDRTVWNGTPTGDIRRGPALQTSQWVAFINSYIYDFHCHSSNAAPCNQSQGIGMGLGTQTLASPVTLCQRGVSTVPAWSTGCPGVYKFVNNYIEGAGENLFSGGGGANYVPSDIEIRRNHLYKPQYWNVNCATDGSGCGTPGAYINGTPVALTDIALTSNVVTAHAAVLPANVTVGVNLINVAGVSNTTFNGGYSVTVSGSGPYTFTYAKTSANIGTISGSGTITAPPFVVINHFELKNGVRVLFEGNVLENGWGGFSQEGFAILLTPKSQNNLCPVCYVSDVVVRYNKVTRTPSMFQVAGVQADGGFFTTSGIERVSLHDDVWDGVFTNSDSTSTAIELTNNCAEFLQNIKFDHLTLTKAFHGAFLLGTTTYLGSVCTMAGVTFTNNIIDAGTFPATVTNGTTGCQQGIAKQPLDLANACWPSYVWSKNAVTSYVGTWPQLQATFAGAATPYVNFSGGICTDCHVTAGSGLQNAGTDGRDIGADVTKLAAETAGVQ